MVVLRAMTRGCNRKSGWVAEQMGGTVWRSQAVESGTNTPCPRETDRATHRCILD